MPADPPRIHDVVLEKYDARFGSRPDHPSRVRMTEPDVLLLLQDVKQELGLHLDEVPRADNLADLIDYLHERWEMDPDA